MNSAAKKRAVFGAVVGAIIAIAGLSLLGGGSDNYRIDYVTNWDIPEQISTNMGYDITINQLDVSQVSSRVIICPEVAEFASDAARTSEPFFETLPNFESVTRSAELDHSKYCFFTISYGKDEATDPVSSMIVDITYSKDGAERRLAYRDSSPYGQNLPIDFSPSGDSTLTITKDAATLFDNIDFASMSNNTITVEIFKNIFENMTLEFSQ